MQRLKVQQVPSTSIRMLSFLYSRAKKSVPLLIFVKIGTKVDLIIQNSMVTLFELLVMSFHDFTTLMSKSIVNVQ